MEQCIMEIKIKLEETICQFFFMLTAIISSGMGPLFWIIYDKIGFKYSIIIIDTISVINGSLINLTVKLGTIFYGISIILNGCLNGGAFSMIFPYVSKIMASIMQENFMDLLFCQLELAL